MKIKQRGFSTIEGLLLLVVALLVVGVGWYVFHVKNSTNSTYNNAANTSSSTASNSSSSTKFVFKEIGVQIALPVELKGLNYTIATTDGNQTLNLSTPVYTDALHRCDSSTANIDKGTFASITKVSGKYDANQNQGVTNLKQFSGFWVSSAQPNGIICSSSSENDNQNFQIVFATSNKALSEAFSSATQVK